MDVRSAFRIAFTTVAGTTMQNTSNLNFSRWNHNLDSNGVVYLIGIIEEVAIYQHYSEDVVD